MIPPPKGVCGDIRAIGCSTRDYGPDGAADAAAESARAAVPFGDYRPAESYTASHAGPTTETALPRRWTGRRTTLDTYIWRSRPRAPALQVMTPTSTAGDRTRSAEVSAGLDNAGCATRLRRQAKEERCWPDPSWNLEQVEGRDYYSQIRDGQGTRFGVIRKQKFI